MTRRLEQGTEIGSVECPGCGRELPLKENKAGGIYYFCGAVINRDENGKAEQCMTRFNYGRAASARIIDEYLKQEETEDVKEPENREEEPAAGEDTGLIAGSGESAGGFKAGLKHFLTGD